MDVLAILILTLALITLCEILWALTLLVFILHKEKNIAIFQYISPPAPISETRQLKLGLFDHLNSHHLKGVLDYLNSHHLKGLFDCLEYPRGLFDHINPPLVLKGLFNYLNPFCCRCAKNANVANLSPAAAERPKKFRWSGIWLPLISSENIVYTIINASMCLLLWTVTCFDIMLTMNSVWGKVWSSFVKTCCLTAPTIFVIYYVDNSPAPISQTPLNPSLGKGPFNISRSSAESAENATVASYQSTDLGYAVIESPNVIANINPQEKGVGKGQNVIANINPQEKGEGKVQNVIANINPQEKGEGKVQNVIAKINLEDKGEGKVQNVIANINLEDKGEGKVQNVIANINPEEKAESKVQNVIANINPEEKGEGKVQDVIPNINPEEKVEGKVQDVIAKINPEEKGEGKDTQQLEELYVIENNEQSKCQRNETDLEEEQVYAVENNEQTKCQRNEADLDNDWEIIDKAEINESSIELV